MAQPTDEQTMCSKRENKAWWKNKLLLCCGIGGIIVVGGGITAAVIASRPKLPVPLSSYWNNQILTYESSQHVTLEPKQYSDGYVNYFCQNRQSSIEILAKPGQDATAILTTFPTSANDNGNSPYPLAFTEQAIQLKSQVEQVDMDYVKNQSQTFSAGNWDVSVGSIGNGEYNVLAIRGGANLQAPDFLTSLPTTTSASLDSSSVDNSSSGLGDNSTLSDSSTTTADFSDPGFRLDNFNQIDSSFTLNMVNKLFGFQDTLTSENGQGTNDDITEYEWQYIDSSTNDFEDVLITFVNGQEYQKTQQGLSG